MTDSNVDRVERHARGFRFHRTTDGVEVSVKPTFIADQSSAEDNLYVWSYEVEITNRGVIPIQLTSRHWKILSAAGQLIEVRGAGVVGDQPTLAPGSSYTYSSYTQLATSSGMMMGTYHMKKESGGGFDVAIPAFSLDSPAQSALPN